MGDENIFVLDEHLTKYQRNALGRLYWRENWTPDCTYREFRARVRWDIAWGCILVPWAGMWIGIEKDGYAHS